jgi:hypothetical protein
MCRLCGNVGGLFHIVMERCVLADDAVRARTLFLSSG